MRLASLALLVAAAIHAAAQPPQTFRLRTNAEPALYGDVLIQRMTADTDTKAVVFSHWIHRQKYTCRVCHLELDFAFARNRTAITEAENRSGAYCGACHDGRTAFGLTEEHCGRCHTGRLEPQRDRFSRLIDALPQARYGNLVDWSRALAAGQITPKQSILGESEFMMLETTLRLEAEWNFVSPAVFPHAEHVRWLDCANCHPAIFNVKKKGTQHFSMRSSLAGNFCGVCHVRVAFPFDDCLRCHPEMKDNPLR